MDAKTKRMRIRKNQVLTEACQKMRQRIRREFIPEFAAWLLLTGQRYEHQVKTLEGDPRLRNLPSTAASIRWCKVATKVIDTLLAGLWETVPRHEWDDVCDAMKEAMAKAKLAEPPTLDIGDDPDAA